MDYSKSIWLVNIPYPCEDNAGLNSDRLFAFLDFHEDTAILTPLTHDFPVTFNFSRFLKQFNI